MYEFIKAGKNTYYINSPVKTGVYLQENGKACLIDTGIDRETGRKIYKILQERNLEAGFIINTHSNADHVGGNAFLQGKTGCPVYSSEGEIPFIKRPVLEPSLIYGGFPPKDLMNKFLMAEASSAEDIVKVDLPEGFEIIDLPGHFIDMIGVKTPDDVYFLADSLVGPEILNKYHISFVYNVRAYLETLDMVENLEGELFVPAHAEAVKDIRPLVQINRVKIFEVEDNILKACKAPASAEEILKTLYDGYGLKLDFNQFALAGSAVRSHLSYLYNEGAVKAEFTENRLLWKAVGTRP